MADDQTVIAILKDRGFSDAEIQQILSSGQPLQPQSNPVQTGLNLANIANKFGAFGGGSAAGAGVAPATPELISGSFVDGSAAGGEGAAATTGLGSLGSLGSILPGAGLALGSYETYQGIKNKNPFQAAIGGGATGALAGAELGGPVGAGIGALLGAPIFGFSSGFGFGGGRSEAEKERAAVRDAAFKSGFADRSTQLGGDLSAQDAPNKGGTYVKLADGSWYDISKDPTGGNAEYNVADPNKAYASQAAMWANPMANLLAGGNKTHADQFAAELVNAMQSNANDPLSLQKNAQSMFSRFNMTPAQASAAIDQEAQQGKFSSQDAAVMKQGLQTMFGTDQNQWDMASLNSPHNIPAQQGKTTSSSSTPNSPSVTLPLAPSATNTSYLSELPPLPIPSSSLTPSAGVNLKDLAPTSSGSPSNSAANAILSAQADAQNQQDAANKKSQLLSMANLGSIRPTPQTFDYSNLMKNRYA